MYPFHPSQPNDHLAALSGYDDDDENDDDDDDDDDSMMIITISMIVSKNPSNPSQTNDRLAVLETLGVMMAMLGMRYSKTALRSIRHSTAHILTLKSDNE